MFRYLDLHDTSSKLELHPYNYIERHILKLKTLFDVVTAPPTAAQSIIAALQTCKQCFTMFKIYNTQDGAIHSILRTFNYLKPICEVFLNKVLWRQIFLIPGYVSKDPK